MIPRVCHMIWIGDQLPPYLAELAATFTAHHPGWQVRWWHEDEIDALEMAPEIRDLYDQAPGIVTADSVLQFRSDLARYLILRQHGGLYADVDYRWQQPIDPHLDGHTLVCGWETQERWAANGIIAAVPDHPAMGEVLADIPRRVATRHPSWRSNRLTGPHPWTPVARRHAHILDQALLHPVPWNRPEEAAGDHPGAVAVHAWNHQREIRGLWPDLERSPA